MATSQGTFFVNDEEQARVVVKKLRDELPVGHAGILIIQLDCEVIIINMRRSEDGTVQHVEVHLTPERGREVMVHMGYAIHEAELELESKKKKGCKEQPIVIS